MTIQFGSPYAYGVFGYGGWGYNGWGYSSGYPYGYPSTGYGSYYHTNRPYYATPSYPQQYLYVQPNLAPEVLVPQVYAKPQAPPPTAVADPNAELRPGMVLPDGAVVVSVGSISDINAPDPAEENHPPLEPSSQDAD